MSEKSEVLEQRCIACGEKKPISEFWSSWKAGKYIAKKCMDCRFNKNTSLCPGCGNPKAPHFDLCASCFYAGHGTL